jgi:alpha-tubulin suppressor-like RCC1 family protein
MHMVMLTMDSLLKVCLKVVNIFIYNMLGDRTNQYIPQRVGVDVISRHHPNEDLRIYCGGHHTILVIGSRTMYVCGARHYGQLGDGKVESEFEWQTTLKRVDLSSSYPMYDILCGMYHTFIRCALYTDGQKVALLRKHLWKCAELENFVDVSVGTFY